MAAPRSTGKLTIAFGLVSVPVSIYSGIDAEAGKIKRSMRTPAGNAVSFVTADAETGEKVARSDTYMVKIASDGTEVPLTDEEIADAMGYSSDHCEVVGFYPIDQIGRYVVEDVKMVRPQTVKSGSKTTRPYDKPFALLMAALALDESFALLRYVSRGSLHLATLTSDGTMNEVHFADEVREAIPMPEADLSPQEISMAKMLIETLKQDEAPLVENDGIARVNDYVEAKAKGVVTVAGVPAKVETADLMAALAASVKMAQAS